MSRDKDALRYHERGRPGKIAVVPTKSVNTQRDLSLAYSPGVAAPCRVIAEDPSAVDRFTARSNLVGVITNGTAVLGLGDIGPLAAKPVMEGKAVLFKKYADIDVFDLEIDEKDPQRFVDTVAALAPTFGGINLEDIAAPACFEIEEALKARLDIPVFHDDQHGTAIISAAALMNACELQEKDIEDVRVTCIGAGAAAMGSMLLWMKLGVARENVTLVDLDGVIREDRPGLDSTRRIFARPVTDERVSLADAIVGADVLIGLSAGNIVSAEMLKTMAERPIVFALANPTPEIDYALAKETRPDAIVGTGRTDFPNQVNNVLGFPYMFRGALDVRASRINEDMKLAAAFALAELAREGVPDDVLSAYGSSAIKFGPDYIIPKPMDERSLAWVAPAVAKAAIESGVARNPIDIDAYRDDLLQKLNPTRRVMWDISRIAKRTPARLVFPEGEEDTILRAADILEDEGIASPVLIGRPEFIEERAATLGVKLRGIEIVDREGFPHLDAYSEELWKLRCRKGLTRGRAFATLRRSRTAYGMMMLQQGEVDGLVSGLTSPYPKTIRPALQMIGTADGVRSACGCYMVVTQAGVKFLADTTVNIDPDAETLAEIGALVADRVKEIGITPRVAMLSFSNFGDAPHPMSEKVAKATRLLKERRPNLMVDGEMQADIALVPSLREPYPFSELVGAANVLIFPNLAAGNIAYKLLSATGSEVIGPMLLGMRRPVNVLQQGANVRTVVHMATMTAASVRRYRTAGAE